MLINLHLFNPLIITADEYEKAMNDIIAKSTVDTLSVGDKILGRLLIANEYRYQEIRWFEMTEEEREKIREIRRKIHEKI